MMIRSTEWRQVATDVPDGPETMRHERNGYMDEVLSYLSGIPTAGELELCPVGDCPSAGGPALSTLGVGEGDFGRFQNADAISQV